MNSLFDYDSLFWRILSRISDYFLLSLLWMVCCIPIVTVPAASIALYDCVSRCIHGKQGGIYIRFFRTLWAELKRSVALALLWTVISALLTYCYLLLRQNAADSEGFQVVELVYTFSLIIPAAVLCWVIAVESRFVYGFGQLHKVAVIFTFAHLPHTAAITVLALLAVFLCLWFPVLLLILPCITAHLQSIFIEKVFVKYMPAETTEAIHGEEPEDDMEE